jgi:hypothetical protein
VCDTIISVISTASLESGSPCNFSAPLHCVPESVCIVHTNTVQHEHRKDLEFVFLEAWSRVVISLAVCCESRCHATCNMQAPHLEFCYYRIKTWEP